MTPSITSGRPCLSCPVCITPWTSNVASTLAWVTWCAQRWVRHITQTPAVKSMARLTLFILATCYCEHYSKKKKNVMRAFEISTIFMKWYCAFIPWSLIGIKLLCTHTVTILIDSREGVLNSLTLTDSPGSHTPFPPPRITTHTLLIVALVSTWFFFSKAIGFATY